MARVNVCSNPDCRDPDCSGLGGGVCEHALTPQNYDEIEACIEIIWGNGLPEDTPKSVLRLACVNRIKSMRNP